MNSSIHRRHFLWYFYDETWAFEYGPYLSKKKAEKELERYCKECLNK